MYENLKNALEAEKQDRKEKVSAQIMNGTTENADQYLMYYLTDSKRTAYKEGRITREAAVDIAIKRAHKKIEKDMADYFKRLHEAEQAGILKSAPISITWKRSPMWGNNPTAELQTTFEKDGYTHYSRVNGTSVGGCGYDKESTAVAQVLNQSPEVMKLLYDAAERQPDKKHHDALGYGSGYGILPYFEGGVGVPCFRAIFEKLGYKWEWTASGKNFDVYTITAQA